jgi:hypothetical protein
MTQAPEQLPARAIGLVALAVIALVAACFVVAWLLVRPTPSSITLPPTTLEHGDYAPYGGSAQLDRDRSIEAAIDAVVADPALIGGHK